MMRGARIPALAGGACGARDRERHLFGSVAWREAGGPAKCRDGRAAAGGCGGRRLLAVWSLALGLSASSLAAARGLCPAQSVPEAPPAELPAGELRLESRRANYFVGGEVLMQGDVELAQGRRRLRTESLRYDTQTRQAWADAPLEYRDPVLRLRGRRGSFDAASGSARFEEAHYLLPATGGRGTADVLQNDGDVTRLEGIDYSTCAGDAGFWRLHARRMRLDRAAGEGRARHLVLRLGGLPVLYAPFFSFPLDERRKTGFLTPRFGISTSTGADLRVPYYWNLAPDRDFTFVWRGMERRGQMLSAEYRRLWRRGNGSLYAEGLPRDRKDRDRGRGLVSLRLDWDAGSGDTGTRRLRLDAERVSDRRYLRDLGAGIGLSASRLLQQRAEADYRFAHGGAHGGWTLLFQGYQSLDEDIAPAEEPYRRLPRFLFDYGRQAPRAAGGPGFSVRGEGAYFDREAGPAGARLDLRPALFWTRRGAAGFLRPEAALRYTRYALDRRQAGTPAVLERWLPSLELRGGMFFLRPVRWLRRDYLQTLEPRLYYRYAPHRAQAALPVFDTGRTALSASSLFYPDRFTGADRVGDVNRLTLALSSRLLAGDTGGERGRLTLGQAYFFRDRRVGLPGEAPQDAAVSPLLQALSLRLPAGFELRQQWDWDPEDAGTERWTLGLRYRDLQTRRLLNLHYRYRRARAGGIGGAADRDLRQVGLSFRRPLGARWALFGLWNHSLAARRPLEWIGGAQYRSCCWALRLVGRRFLTGKDREYTSNIFLQLELLGLAGIGRAGGNLLRRSIPGYEDDW
ncbi:MAG: LPS assembly protein LptD [Gammaproteobacteria bacterium]|nr:LPS assembly protein LptD [Gammaproteobacteria bacterium]